MPAAVLFALGESCEREDISQYKVLDERRSVPWHVSNAKEGADQSGESRLWTRESSGKCIHEEKETLLYTGLVLLQRTGIMF